MQLPVSTPHASPIGQVPPHRGAMPPHRAPATHSQPERPSRHVEPTAQSPPQVGAADSAQSSGAGRQAQLPALIPHAWPTGQSPPHSGAVPAQEESATHSQPIRPSWQTDPTAHAPPQVGAKESRQGTGITTHIHIPLSFMHSSSSGHSPPQMGASELSQLSLRCRSWCFCVGPSSKGHKITGANIGG